MRSSLLLLLLSLLLGCTAPRGRERQNRRQRQQDQGHLSLRFGQRWLDDGEFPDIDEPSVAGAELEWIPAGAAFGFEIGVLYARDETTIESDGEFEVTMTELTLGAKKRFDLRRVPRIQPYVGGGLATLLGQRYRAIPGETSVDEDDLDAGLYLHGGIDLWITESLTVGLDLRVLREDFLESSGVDLDYEQLTLGLGVRF